MLDCAWVLAGLLYWCYNGHHLLQEAQVIQVGRDNPAVQANLVSQVIRDSRVSQASLECRVTQASQAAQVALASQVGLSAYAPFGNARCSCQ